MLGCTRGPGFSDLADNPPSRWLCWCQCHPVNCGLEAEKVIFPHRFNEDGTRKHEAVALLPDGIYVSRGGVLERMGMAEPSK
jgi:hypothetical protein